MYELERLVKYIMDYSSLLKRILGDRRLSKEESQTFRKMFESFPRLADRSSKEFNNLTEIIFKEIEKALRQRKRVCELDMTTLLLALGNQTVDSASFKVPNFPAMSGSNVSSPFTSNFHPSLYSNPPILNFSSTILMPNPIHQNNYISTPLIPTTSSAATSKTSIYEKQLGIYQRKLNMFFQYASSKKKNEDAANIQKLADGLKEVQKNDSFKSIPFEADINQLLNEVENSLAQDIPIKLLESDINQLLSKFSKLQPPLIKAPPPSSSRSKSQLYQVHPMSSSMRPTGSSITKAIVKPTTKRPRIGN